MKSVINLSVALFLIALVSCKPSPQKASEYFDEISKPLELVLNKEDALIQIINAQMKNDSTTHDTLNKSDTATKTLVSALDMAFANFSLQIATSLNQMETIGKFDNSLTLRDAAMGLLKEYEAVSSTEFPALIEIVKIPVIDYTNEDDARFFTLSDSIDSKLQRKIDVYLREVKLFAKEYNFQLEKDTLKSEL